VFVFKKLFFFSATMFSSAATAGADVRVDEEGKEKYQQILDLLLAGGYFRARITGLSPFDKVIGGMAWAITSSAGDLDIDIFFQEDAQIGQKIKLGEQILDGLKRLGCTLPLQAFQIQGLDFKSIFPVIQWLITKVMEVRAETGDLVRAYSEAQFNKVHSMPSDAAFALKLPKAAQYAASVTDTYRPRRQFVHRGGDAHAARRARGGAARSPRVWRSWRLQCRAGGGGCGGVGVVVVVHLHRVDGRQGRRRQVRGAGARGGGRLSATHGASGGARRRRS
jgi:hypothetical protein